MECEKDTPDLIVNYEDQFKSYKLCYGVFRILYQHSKIIYVVEKTVISNLLALKQNMKISRQWDTDHGRQSHKIYQQLMDTLKELKDHLLKMDNKQCMDDIYEAIRWRDWQETKALLYQLKQQVMEHWQKFEKLGLKLVRKDIPPLLERWKTLNPKLPCVLALLQSGIFSAVFAKL